MFYSPLAAFFAAAFAAAAALAASAFSFAAAVIHWPKMTRKMAVSRTISNEPLSLEVSVPKGMSSMTLKFFANFVAWPCHSPAPREPAATVANARKLEVGGSEGGERGAD
jgi:hypothetical protein